MTLPVWALCQQAEVGHVAGPDVGRTAPPPMVAHLLHSVNPLLNQALMIANQSDLEVAQSRPSWIRNLSIVTNDVSIGLAALSLEGLRSIKCPVALPVAQLASSRTLKVLYLNPASGDISGIEFCPALEELLLSGKAITSLTSLDGRRTTRGRNDCHS